MKSVYTFYKSDIGILINFVKTKSYFDKKKLKCRLYTF